MFEAIYPIDKGMSYNSYFIDDEKTVLFDTVDKVCAEQFYENLDNYINNNYDDTKKLLQIRNEKDIINSLYRIASNTVRPFICFLNTPNKNKFIKDVFEYLQYQLDIREGKKESISYEHIGMTFSDYSYTYGNIKPTESDIYVYLQDISNSLKG